MIDNGSRLERRLFVSKIENHWSKLNFNPPEPRPERPGADRWPYTHFGDPQNMPNCVPQHFSAYGHAGNSLNYKKKLTASMWQWDKGGLHLLKVWLPGCFFFFQSSNFGYQKTIVAPISRGWEFCLQVVDIMHISYQMSFFMHVLWFQYYEFSKKCAWADRGGQVILFTYVYIPPKY